MRLKATADYTAVLFPENSAAEALNTIPTPGKCQAATARGFLSSRAFGW